MISPITMVSALEAASISVNEATPASTIISDPFSTPTRKVLYWVSSGPRQALNGWRIVIAPPMKISAIYPFSITPGSMEAWNPKPPAILAMDKSSKTLTDQKLYENNLSWDQHEICSGTADLPSGQIKEGDKITNCKGNIALRHVPSNTLLGGFDFEE